METKELNKKIAQLFIRAKNMDDLDKFEKDYKILYYEDKEFIKMNKKSVLAMIRLNLRYRIIPFHSFGIHIPI